MNIKVRNHTTITEDVKNYCLKRFSKIEEMLPANSFFEIEFIDEYGARQGVDKKVEVDISIPGEKQTIHLENLAPDWMTSIDVLKSRLEKEIVRHKERLIDNHRGPRIDKI